MCANERPRWNSEAAGTELQNRILSILLQIKNWCVFFLYSFVATRFCHDALYFSRAVSCSSELIHRSLMKEIDNETSDTNSEA